ncbi:MAG: Dot/Icm secretion system protein IcmQ [Gammaproteobacteria bacterium]|nr:Dot/Icm secretion system protein IcmQ [Gammaproteobacteria bacterium]
MDENKPLTPPEIGHKLIAIIDKLLVEGNWETSLFLRASAARLIELRQEAERVALAGNTPSAATGGLVAVQLRTPPSGYIQVFVSLYQVEGTNLQKWEQVLKSLCEHSITRPAYKDEEHVKQFIRSKADINHLAYVVTNIKPADIYQLEQTPVDSFGHELLTLKEGVIKAANIVEFVHANKKRYFYRDNKLIFAGEFAV